MRERNRRAMVWLDPPGTLVGPGGALGYAVRHGLTPTTTGGPTKFIYDEIWKTDRCPHYPILTPSRNPDADQQDAENRVSIETMKGLLVQAEGKTGTQGTSVTDEGLTNILNLFLYQKQGTNPDFTTLHQAFRAGPVAYKLLANCTRRDVQETIDWYHRLSYKDHDFHCGPAMRRLRKVAESPQFRRRCQLRENPTDWAAFFNAGGILMLDGASKKNLSKTDLTLVISTVMLMVLSLVRSGLTRELILIGDEGQTASFLDDNIAIAAAEAGKWGLTLDFCLQKPFHPNPNVQQAIQNFDTIYTTKQIDPPAVKFVAELFAQPNFDPLAVHYVEERIRLVDEEDTSKWITVEGTSESEGSTASGATHSVTKSFQLRPVKREEKDQVERYKNPDLQRREYEKMLTRLNPGEFLVKTGNAVAFEPVLFPMLERPWAGLNYKRHPRVTLAERKCEIALDLMRQRPEYQVSLASQPWTPSDTPSTDDAADKLAAGEL